MLDAETEHAGIREVVLDSEPKLRPALIAFYGPDRGRDATCEALAYAWQQSTWSGPLIVGAAGTTFSAPAAVINQSAGLVSVFAEGAKNSRDAYGATPGQSKWSGPLIVGGPGTTCQESRLGGVVNEFAEPTAPDLDVLGHSSPVDCPRRP